jgi:hypothetical protein
MTNRPWDGKRVLGDTLALAIPDRDKGRKATWSLPEFILLATQDFTISLEPHQVGSFLRGHRDATIACFDVDSTFWAIEALLRGQAENEGRSALFGLASACRIHDVRLLHQLIQLALYGSSEEPKGLAQVADYCRSASYSGWKEDGLTDAAILPVSDSLLVEHCGGPMASEVLRVYIAQRNMAALIAQRGNIDEGLAHQFGPLSVGFQAQGAIALGRMGRRGLRLPPGTGHKLHQLCEQTYLECSRRLLADTKAAHGFKLDQMRVKRDHLSRLPSQKSDALREWLVAELNMTSGMFDIPPVPPLTLDGKVSILPEFWGDLLQLRDQLKDWAGLWSAATTSNCVRELDEKGDGKLYPSYEMFPRLRSQ